LASKVDPDSVRVIFRRKNLPMRKRERERERERKKERERERERA